MENTTSQELQSLEAQLQAEFAGTQVAPTESNEIVKPEGIKEGNQEKVSNEKTDSDTQSDTDSSSDNERVSKLEEQRKRMLATKSKDEKEKELLRSEVEQYKTRLQEVDSIIKKYETWEIERTLETDTAYIDARTEKKVSEVQIRNLERQDKIAFLRDNDFTTDEFSWIEEIKSSYPSLTWDKATKLYLAENNPEHLVPKQSKQTPLSVGTETKISEPIKNDKDKSITELEKELKALEKYS